MAGFIYFLLRNRIYKREKIKNGIPSNSVESFYNDWFDGIDLLQDTDF